MDTHRINVSFIKAALEYHKCCTYSDWKGAKGSDIDILCSDMKAVAYDILLYGGYGPRVIVTRYPSQIHIDYYRDDDLELRLDLHGKRTIKRTFWQKLKARVKWLLQ